MSLLTDFYPNGGGGGGGAEAASLIGGVGGTYSYVLLYGSDGSGTPPTTASGVSAQGCLVVPNTASNRLSGNAITGYGQYTRALYHETSLSIGGTNVDNLKTILLSNAVNTMTVAMTALTSIGGWGLIRSDGVGAPNLESWAPGVSLVPWNGTDVLCQNTKLDAVSVSGILVNLNKLLWAASTINLSGGTAAGAARLTADGTAAVAGLRARGCTVTLNP
jgi:hypothetical protein